MSNKKAKGLNFADRNKIELSQDIFGSKYAYKWDDFYDFIIFVCDIYYLVGVARSQYAFDI